MKKGRYLVHNPVLRAYLTLAELWAKLTAGSSPPIPSSPKSFLICNTAHIGDTIMMTAILSVLRHFFPEAKIGIVVANASLPLLQNHPLINQIHIVDHWATNRQPLPLWKKILHYRKTAKTALKTIKDEHYDVAIDTYYYFGNAIPLLKKAKIPTRIGYTSGGFGPWLSHSLPWENKDQSVIDYYPPLLHFLGITETEGRPYLKPFMTAKTSQTAREILSLNQDYIVLHMGSGDSRKQWPLEKWKLLAKQLEGPLVLTGRGEDEHKWATELAAEVPSCLNVVNKMSFNDYTRVIKDAKLLIGVDSMSAHLASALGVPCITLFAGMNNIHHWKPFGTECITLTHPMPCSPCYKGCATMNCIRDLSVEQVLKACQLKFFQNPKMTSI